MSILFNPRVFGCSRSASVTAPARAALDASAQRFADRLALPYGNDDAHRGCLTLPHATPVRFERLDSQPGDDASELNWRLTYGRFSGLVIRAHMQQHTLLIRLITVNAEQRAFAARHRTRIETACAAHFTGHTVVTWCDETDCA